MRQFESEVYIHNIGLEWLTALRYIHSLPRMTHQFILEIFGIDDCSDGDSHATNIH